MHSVGSWGVSGMMILSFGLHGVCIACNCRSIYSQMIATLMLGIPPGFFGECPVQGSPKVYLQCGSFQFLHFAVGTVTRLRVPHKSTWGVLSTASLAQPFRASMAFSQSGGKTYFHKDGVNVNIQPQFVRSDSARQRRRRSDVLLRKLHPFVVMGRGTSFSVADLSIVGVHLVFQCFPQLDFFGGLPSCEGSPKCIFSAARFSSCHFAVWLLWHNCVFSKNPTSAFSSTASLAQPFRATMAFSRGGRQFSFPQSWSWLEHSTTCDAPCWSMLETPAPGRCVHDLASKSCTSCKYLPNLLQACGILFCTTNDMQKAWEIISAENISQPWRGVSPRRFFFGGMHGGCSKFLNIPPFFLQKTNDANRASSDLIRTLAKSDQYRPSTRCSMLYLEFVSVDKHAVVCASYKRPQATCCFRFVEYQMSGKKVLFWWFPWFLFFSRVCWVASDFGLDVSAWSLDDRAPKTLGERKIAAWDRFACTGI